MNAREEILRRIAVARVETPGPVVRDYDQATAFDDAVELFVERASDYRAVVTYTDPLTAPEVIADRALAPGCKSVLLPPGFPEDLGSALSRLVDVSIGDETLPLSVAAEVDCVVTLCRLGIALTGTVVLDSGPGQGRRMLTLLPDHHVVVIHDNQIVGSVPEAIAALDPRRPLTWISGPSATSDIELTRVEGVHGPRRLDIIVIRTRLADQESPRHS